MKSVQAIGLFLLLEFVCLFIAAQKWDRKSDKQALELCLAGTFVAFLLTMGIYLITQ